MIPRWGSGAAVDPMAIPAHWAQDPFFPDTFPHPKFAPHFTVARPPRDLIGKAGKFTSFVGLAQSNSSAE